MTLTFSFLEHLDKELQKVNQLSFGHYVDCEDSVSELPLVILDGEEDGRSPGDESSAVLEEESMENNSSVEIEDQSIETLKIKSIHTDLAQRTISNKPCQASSLSRRKQLLPRSLLASLNLLQEKVKKLTKERDSVLTKHQLTKQKLKDTDRQATRLCDELQQELETEKRRAQQWKHKYHKLEKRSEKKTRNLEDELKKSRTDLRDTRNENGELSREILYTKEKNASLGETIQKLQEHLADSKREHSDELNDVHTTKRVLQARNSDLSFAIHGLALLNETLFNKWFRLPKLTHGTALHPQSDTTSRPSAWALSKGTPVLVSASKKKEKGLHHVIEMLQEEVETLVQTYQGKVKHFVDVTELSKEGHTSTVIKDDQIQEVLTLLESIEKKRAQIRVLLSTCNVSKH